jgi:hypothetical protein
VSDDRNIGNEIKARINRLLGNEIEAQIERAKAMAELGYVVCEFSDIRVGDQITLTSVVDESGPAVFATVVAFLTHPSGYPDTLRFVATVDDVALIVTRHKQCTTHVKRTVPPWARTP